VSGRSWAWVLAMALAVAACSATPQERPSELDPTEAAAPAPPDGMIVGVAVVGRTPSTDAGWMTRGKDVYLRYWHRAGTFGELLMVRESSTLEGTVAATENGMSVIYRPFAMRVPAGEGQFVLFGNRRTIPRTGETRGLVTSSHQDRKGHWHTRSEWITSTIDAPMKLTSASDVPPATFEVAPGKVRYIGRLGMLVHVTSPSGPQSRHCAVGQLEQFSSKHKQELCVDRELVVGSAPEADLAMIRRRFPNLAGAEIEIRPVQFGSGGWQDFGQAARRYGAGP
jgi:hypothetical protein